MVGTAEKKVGRCVSTRSQKVSAEKRGAMMTLPPDRRTERTLMIRPLTWKSGDVRDGLKPGVVRGESDEFTYLVMPVRLPAAVS